MILECWFYMFRGIYRHLIKAQEQIYSRFVQNVKLAKPTFSTRRGDTRRTAWACATCLLFENLFPVASYSRRVSDLKVPINKPRILTFSRRRQNRLNGVLDETRTARTRIWASCAHASLCKFTSGSRRSLPRPRVLRSLLGLRGCFQFGQSPYNPIKNVTYMYLLASMHWV